MISPPRVLVIGDINLDVIFRCSTYPEEGADVLVKTPDQRLGGSGCNTAIALSKLGVLTEILGHIGDDAFGMVARNRLKASGVDTRLVLECPAGTTGWMMILVTPGGQRTIFGYRGCNSLPYLKTDRLSILGGQDIIHVSGYTFLEADQWKSVQQIMMAAHSQGKRISLDPGMDATQKAGERIFSILPCVDYLLISELELSKLSPNPSIPMGCQDLLARGVKSVVLKMGARGSCVRTKDTETLEPAFNLPGYQVQDTTGAGDCFNAGFLAGQLLGLTPADSLILGNATAYYTVTSLHGMEDLVGERSFRSWISTLIRENRGRELPLIE